MRNVFLITFVRNDYYIIHTANLLAFLKNLFSLYHAVALKRQHTGNINPQKCSKYF